jgi:hypothetical protein
MAEHTAFALGQSNLNGFLFADIGVERSGMNVSVMSALARVGLDPWQEAARLAGLPRAAATEVLARLIAAMPQGLWPMPVATPIAARLVTLLPGQNDSPLPRRPQIGVNWRWLLIAGLVVVIGLALLARSIPTPEALPAAAPKAEISAPANPVLPPSKG